MSCNLNSWSNYLMSWRKRYDNCLTGCMRRLRSRSYRMKMMSRKRCWLSGKNMTGMMNMSL